jgi:predicted XRE-type DNA-binding protein
LVQSGRSAVDWKPIPLVGPAVVEVRVHEQGAGKAKVIRATKGNGNVFLDCGFPPAEAENLRIRAKLMMALTRYLEERKLTQFRAAKIMGVSQPRISDLVRGKIGLFTIDTLVNMVPAAGLKVDLDITAGGSRPKNKQVA